MRDRWFGGRHPSWASRAVMGGSGGGGGTVAVEGRVPLRRPGGVDEPLLSGVTADSRERGEVEGRLVRGDDGSRGRSEGKGRNDVDAAMRGVRCSAQAIGGGTPSLGASVGVSVERPSRHGADRAAIPRAPASRPRQYREAPPTRVVREARRAFVTIGRRRRVGSARTARRRVEGAPRGRRRRLLLGSPTGFRKRHARRRPLEPASSHPFSRQWPRVTHPRAGRQGPRFRERRVPRVRSPVTPYVDAVRDEYADDPSDD